MADIHFKFGLDCFFQLWLDLEVEIQNRSGGKYDQKIGKEFTKWKSLNNNT